MKTFKQYISEKNSGILYHDENENAIVHDDGKHRISIDKPGNASHVVLWHKGDDEKWSKAGELSTREKTKKINGASSTFLSVNNVEIKSDSRGKGLGTKMYKSLLQHSGKHITGIISHTPDRTNLKQVPSIYKSLGAEEHEDYQVIRK